MRTLRVCTKSGGGKDEGLPPIRVAISTGRREIEYLRGDLAGGKVNVAEETNKTTRKKYQKFVSAVWESNGLPFSTMNSGIQSL